MSAWTPIPAPEGVVIDPQSGEQMIIPADATRILGCNPSAVSALAIAGKIRRKGRFVFWEDVQREIPKRKIGRPSSYEARRALILAEAAAREGLEG